MKFFTTYRFIQLEKKPAKKMSLETESITSSKTPWKKHNIQQQRLQKFVFTTKTSCRRAEAQDSFIYAFLIYGLCLNKKRTAYCHKNNNSKCHHPAILLLKDLELRFDVFFTINLFKICVGPRFPKKLFLLYNLVFFLYFRSFPVNSANQQPS